MKHSFIILVHNVKKLSDLGSLIVPNFGRVHRHSGQLNYPLMAEIGGKTEKNK